MSMDSSTASAQYFQIASSGFPEIILNKTKPWVIDRLLNLLTYL